jgi:N-acetylmuramoyl-L-alanine amidase
MKRVYLSPSNQMRNECVWGDVEGKHAVELANLIGQRLTAHGIEWKIRKPSNSLSANMREAKAWGADLYLPLHTNAAGAGARGTRFGYNSKRADSKAACQVFMKRWQTFYPLPDHVKLAVYDHFGEAKSPHCPSVYVELVFHSNVNDAAWFHANMGACADCLVECVLDYFTGHEAEAPKPTTLPTLKRGSKGEYVKSMQHLLNQYGAELAVDGDFGPITQAAVKAFQALHHLTVDGICGPITWNALTKADETA